MIVANADIPAIKLQLSRAGVIWGKSQNPSNSLYDKGMFRDIPVGFIKVNDEVSDLKALLPSQDFNDLLDKMFNVVEDEDKDESVSGL